MPQPYCCAILSAASCVSTVIGTGDGHNIRIASSAPVTSSHDICNLRRATDTNSFSTCTLSMPPLAIKSSAAWERGSSWTMAYTKTFVSRNALSLIRFLAVEDESGRKTTPQLAQVIKSAFTAPVASDFKSSAPSDPNLDAVAFFQFEGFDDRCRQTNRQAVSPL